MNSKEETTTSALDEVAEAVIVSKSRFSLVWLVPFVAALIAAWLGYNAFSEQGPLITITFSTAEGIEAGKTKIRYKDVEIGLVKEVTLSQDLSQVRVSAELVKGAERYLTEETRFWIVRARVGAGEVSGLSTLVSGVYIGIDPVMDGKRVSDFTGLEKAPIVTADEEGRHYVLRARSLGSTDTGSLVYYRQIEVGQVVGYELSADGEFVDIQIFVRAPHHKRINTSTRFWDTSGLDLSVDASGVQVNTESLVSMVLGGIAFETPVSLEQDEPAKENTVFELYESRKAAQIKRYSKKNYYLLYFEESVRGLEPGAPVEFHGMQIGHVIDVRIEFDPEQLNVRIPVLIEIEPERFNIVRRKNSTRPVASSEVDNAIDALVSKGLGAQLKMANLLTGQLIVALDFDENAAPTRAEPDAPYPVLPTIPAPLEEIAGNAAEIIDKLNHLPLAEIGRDLQQALAGANKLMNTPELMATIALLNDTLIELKALSRTLNTESAPALNNALSKAEATLSSAQSLIGPDAPAGRELNRLLIELAEAARAIGLVADYLERHPEALIFGKDRGETP